MDDREARVQVPEDQELSLLHIVQTRPGVHRTPAQWHRELFQRVINGRSVMLITVSNYWGGQENVDLYN
jgi:hypothetical protein